MVKYQLLSHAGVLYLTYKMALLFMKKYCFFKYRYTGSEVRVRDDDLRLAHVAIAVEGSSWSNADTIPLMVASTLIGSWDRSMANAGNIGSKLAQKAAQHNLCHSFQSFNTCYSDTGLWGCYLVTDKMLLDDFLLQLHNEWFVLERQAFNDSQHILFTLYLIIG